MVTTHSWRRRTDRRIAPAEYIGRRTVITIHHPSRAQAGTIASQDSSRAAGCFVPTIQPTFELRCLLRYDEKALHHASAAAAAAESLGVHNDVVLPEQLKPTCCRLRNGF